MDVSEMGEAVSEVAETKAEINDYQKIKPEGEMSVSDAKAFWNEMFSNEITTNPENETQHENPHQEVIDGETYYYGDNGNLYRVGNELVANSEYSINGYDYKTDEQSRIISARGKIQTKNHEGRPPIEDSMENIGRGDQKKTDDRGHLIADRFNGGNGLENLIPMDSELNRKGGDYYKLEDYMADAVASGADVYAEINVVYDGDSARPSKFRIIVFVDGEKEIYVFKNEGGNSNDAG